MGKFDGILICTDLDGTLLREDKSISKENLEAIEYFKSEGGLFTFITGRMPFFAKKMYETINPNVPFGCINGGALFDHVKGEYLWKTPLDKDVLDLIRHVDENVKGDMGFQINVFDNVYFCRENITMRNWRRLKGGEFVLTPYNSVEAPYAKILFGSEYEEVIFEIKGLLESHPRAKDYTFVRSEYTLFEILPKGITKSSAMMKLVELLNLDASKTVAIGDYDNDVGMLRAAKVGVAVANAVPVAKEAADYITVSNEESAIARVIYDIENGAIKFD